MAESICPVSRKRSQCAQVCDSNPAVLRLPSNKEEDHPKRHHSLNGSVVIEANGTTELSIRDDKVEAYIANVIEIVIKTNFFHESAYVPRDTSSRNDGGHIDDECSCKVCKKFISHSEVFNFTMMINFSKHATHLLSQRSEDKRTCQTKDGLLNMPLKVKHSRNRY